MKSLLKCGVRPFFVVVVVFFFFFFFFVQIFFPSFFSFLFLTLFFKDTFLVNNPMVKDVSGKSFEKFQTDVVKKLQPSKTPAKNTITRASLNDSPSAGTPSSGEGLSASLFGKYRVSAPKNLSAEKKRAFNTPSPVAMPATAGGTAVKSERNSPAITPLTNSNKVDNYMKRRGAGDVRVDFNSHLSDVMEVSTSSSVKKIINVDVEQTVRPYKYMWDPIKSRAEAVKKRTEYLGMRLLSLNEDLLDLELGAFHLPKAEDIVCYGKICSENSDEKLEPNGILLEGQAPENDNIYRIKLNMKDIKSYTMFPGQVVALKGVNPTGSEICVKHLLTDASQSVAMTDDTSVYTKGPVKVTMASGPFCTHENLDYRPLQDLMDTVLSNKTDVLVLMGPFVDAKHPDIASGNLDRTFDDLWRDVFQYHVIRRVESHNSTCARGKTIQRVVLIPSVDDIHHHPVFPQPPLDLDSHTPKDLVLSLGNPCQIRINGILFGFTTVDSLVYLSGAAYLRRDNAQGVSVPRILEMAGQLIEQQSFMPLNPTPPDINFDSTNAQLLEFAHETPQVLVLPSNLKEFADPINGILLDVLSFIHFFPNRNANCQSLPSCSRWFWRRNLL